MIDIVDVLREKSEDARRLGMWYATDNQRLLRYREMLLCKGFEETVLQPYHFWKIVTDKTAFIVNLKDLTDGVGVVYGIYSTAALWNKREWEYHWLMGTHDHDCHLRFYSVICSDEEESDVLRQISEMYESYSQWDKDAILVFVKEKRKEFMKQITSVLNPLGFKKRGNEWYRKQEDGGVRHFWADKSPYTDMYGFCTACSYPSQPERTQEYRLICMEPPRSSVWDSKSYASHLFDWQLHTKEDLMEILDRFIREHLE